MPRKTLRQVVAALDEQFPGMKEQLVEEDHVRPGLVLVINGVIATTGLMAAVPDG